MKKQEPCSQGAHILQADNRLGNKRMCTSSVQRAVKKINQRDGGRVAPLDGGVWGVPLQGADVGAESRRMKGQLVRSQE